MFTCVLEFSSGLEVWTRLFARWRRYFYSNVEGSLFQMEDEPILRETDILLAPSAFTPMLQSFAPRACILNPTFSLDIPGNAYTSVHFPRTGFRQVTLCPFKRLFLGRCPTHCAIHLHASGLSRQLFIDIPPHWLQRRARKEH